MRRFIYVVLLCLAGSLPMQAQTPAEAKVDSWTGYRNVRFGMSREDLFKARWYDAESSDFYVCRARLLEFGKAKLSAAGVKLDKGVVATFQLRADGRTDMQNLLQALQSQFGMGKVDKKDVMHRSWSGKKISVDYQEYKDGYSTATFTDLSPQPQQR